jgi:2-oxoglutarate dehydrogenase E2 component (dihydrolipoamide succinyltransferase)
LAASERRGLFGFGFILSRKYADNMAIELKVPAVGESITEVQIGEWRKNEGDSAEKDENLVEIETDKATVELPAPIKGRLAKVLKRSGEVALVGEVIGYMEETAADAVDAVAAAAAQAQAADMIRTPAKRAAESPRPAAETAKPAEAKPAAARQGNDAQSAAKPAAAKPTPATERGLVVTPDSRSADGARPAAGKAKTDSISVSGAPRGDREEEAVPMSPIRRRIAQRLVEAQHTAALLTTFNEIDMSAVMALRSEHKDVFLEKFGVKLGFMSFFVKASIDALKLVPQVNAEIRGNDIIYHNYFDIGIAVGGGKGLVVPVLRDADRMSFAEIESTIAELAHRARENSLLLEELRGGTFTISNGGVYGSLLSTPIVNPPQSGILGLHTIQDRPVAREGQVVIRPMMYVALTYDHRIVDGQNAVTFLKRIKEVMEEPLRMLVEV